MTVQLLEAAAHHQHTLAMAGAITDARRMTCDDLQEKITEIRQEVRSLENSEREMKEELLLQGLRTRLSVFEETYSERLRLGCDIGHNH